jgi:hypothetical protein
MGKIPDIVDDSYADLFMALSSDRESQSFEGADHESCMAGCVIPSSNSNHDFWVRETSPCWVSFFLGTGSDFTVSVASCTSCVTTSGSRNEVS